MKLIHLTTPAPIAARGGKPKKGSFGTPAAACIPGHCPRVEPWVIGVIVGAIVFGILLLAGAYYGYTKERDRKRQGKSFRPGMILWGAIKVSCFIWVGYVVVEELLAWRERRKTRREGEVGYGKVVEGDDGKTVETGYSGGWESDGGRDVRKYAPMGHTGAARVAGTERKDSGDGSSPRKSETGAGRDDAVRPLMENERFGRPGRHVSTESTFAPSVLSSISVTPMPEKTAYFPPVQPTYAMAGPRYGRQ